MTHSMRLENIGPIKEASLSFSDLTVLVGPQASGKSVGLQWLKMLLDPGAIQKQLHDYGLDWDDDLGEFMDIYFGEGMRSLWKEGKSRLFWGGKEVDPNDRVKRRGWGNKESVFFIPAQRVLALRDGWPRPFGDFSSGDPYAVRSYSEKLRVLMERELYSGQAIFPRANRLKKEYRDVLQDTIFAGFDLSVDKIRSQKRLVLRQAKLSHPLPYMVWSAGQREFIPLLLGLYWLMPSASVAQRDDIEWVVIEELEMGLHPRAISAVLLLVLELLYRGYKVVLSTHSPQVLDAVWAMQILRNYKKTQPKDFLGLFDAPNTQSLREVASNALKKKTAVYYFEGSGGRVHDISELDPSSDLTEEASWGGLLEFSGRASDVVARAVSSQ